MEIVVIACLVIFGALAVIGSLWLLGVIFSESILWGLACLFVPGASFVFVITHWDQSKRPFGFHLVGLVGLFATAASSGIMSGQRRTSADHAPVATAANQPDPCPATAPPTDGFSRWCCAWGSWKKLSEGGDCTSSPAPSDVCDTAHQGAMTTEACSSLGAKKRRR